jgi:N-acetylmuramoyl-L-alanine amidase
MLLALLFLIHDLQAQEQETTYLSTKPEPGDGIFTFLNRYQLYDSCNREEFSRINQTSDSSGLNLSKSYQLPIQLYQYDGVSIRTTIGIDNYSQAKEIALFNDTLWVKGLKKEDYRSGKLLWVPRHLLQCYPGYIEPDQELKDTLVSEQVKKEEVPTVVFPLLGKEDEVIDIRGDELGNHIYYLVSGHGGPDPGAMGTYNDCKLCEDEYAYDITLRLANNLIRHGAEVYVIIQDPDDGIRNEAILECDYDELCYGDAVIPRNQVKRLKQRTDTINSLYRKNRELGNKIQRLMVFHVDSRQVDQRVDMFFYHARNSKSGKKMADNLRLHIDGKYNLHQKSRGYDGSVKMRSLFMVRNTLPTTVYVELGNIQNEKDQKRFLLETNRQAIANWFTEGIIIHENSMLE